MSKNNCAVTIIGGADGPTSVFLVGKRRKTPLKYRLRNYFYKKRSIQVQKKITAASHTLEETLSYLMENYGAVEKSSDSRTYKEEYEGLRESLIIRYQPELLGEYAELGKPDRSDEASVRAFMERAEKRRQIAASVPEEAFPMDFHIYEIVLQGIGKIKYVIEKQWGIFSYSYSGDKKKRKACKKVVQDIQLFYGVTKEDIQNQTERYKRLVAVLSM